MNLYREVELGGGIKEKIRQEAQTEFDGEYSHAIARVELCYWRKFNALHKYFFDKFGNGENDNCVNMYMEISDIKELLERLLKLRDSIKLVYGLVNNGYTIRTWKPSETVECVGGSKKASKLVDNDIIIENDSKGWVSDIKKAKDGITAHITYKQEGRVVANPEICEELLPTEEGFFFGGTEYDEWYVQDIENTISMLKKVIDQHNALVSKGYNDYDITYYYRAWY